VFVYSTTLFFCTTLHTAAGGEQELQYTMGQSGLFVQVVPLQRLRAIAAISRRTAARRVLQGLRANVANKAYHKNKTQIDAATKIEVWQHLLTVTLYFLALLL
jgi:hypothetical protein